MVSIIKCHQSFMGIIKHLLNQQTNVSMFTGLLQDSAKYLEMYLDEVWKQIDHWWSEKTCHSC